MLKLIILVLIIVMFIFYIKTKNYELDICKELDKKEHPLKGIYPCILYILNKFSLEDKLCSYQLKMQLDAVSIHKNKKYMVKLYLAKKISLFLGILSSFIFLSFVISIKNVPQHNLIENNWLTRPLTSKDNLVLDTYLETVSGKIKKKLSLSIDPKKYTEKEIEEAILNAKAYVNECYLGENESNYKVAQKLNLIAAIPDSFISVEWDLGLDGFVKTGGILDNDKMLNPQNTYITASFIYEERRDKVFYPITVYPKEHSENELLFLGLEQEIENRMKESLESQKVQLPSKYKGNQVIYNEVHSKNNGFYIFIIMAIVVLYFVYDKKVEDELKKRNAQLLLDYPELIQKFTMLLSAGMTVKNAWKRISKEYSKSGTKKHYVYEEMIIASNEMDSGIVEIEAVENFGRRINLMPYLKFSSLVVQNLKKGSKGLLELLEFEAVEAFEERKELAKRLGEEAGTKLLLPMGIMLIIVFIIILVPALLTF